jgi:hypothetical protein
MQTRNKFILIPTALSLAFGVIVLSLRLWNKRFVAVEMQSIPLEVEGQIKSGRRVTVQSIFNLTPQETWSRIQTPQLLSQITRPVITFSCLDGQPMPAKFLEQQTIQLKMQGLGLLPLGQHTITIEKIDHERREIQSREHGQIAQLWRHRIAVQPYGQIQTLYTDQIDLYAGPQTGAVASFARLFYMFRQTRWQQLHSSVPLST